MSEEKIDNINIYNERMAKSLFDKMFFMNMLYPTDVDSLLDYGCADGSLIEAMQMFVPQMKYFGLDLNDDMIEQSKIKVPTATFSTSKEELFKNGLRPQDCVINLSSLIHELYTYCSQDEIENVWDFVFNSGFRYISIRDMCPDESIDRQADINSIMKVRSKCGKQYIQEHENNFGSIQNNKSFVHFLLKYKYIENWTREVKENYIPITLQELLARIPIDRYEILYLDNFTLPFMKQQIRYDLGVDLIDNTHVKILLKLINNPY